MSAGARTEGPVSWRSAVGGGFFLASSWTWCIGMWLPVYLARDFGWPGWLAFVIPNALGAMAMGLVLRRQGSSAALVRRHRTAMHWFSLVTVVFQVSFLSWWLTRVSAQSPVGQGFVGAAAAWVVAGLGVWLAGRRSDWWTAGAVGAFGVSIAAWILSARTGNSIEWPLKEGLHSGRDLLLAVPVLVFGFAACPYLDLTFHRARTERPGPTGSIAFVIGFVALFPLLMVYSAMYAGGILSRSMSYYLVAHLGVQILFTIAAHAREIMAGWPDEDRGRRIRRAWRFVLVLGLAGCSSGLPWMEDYRSGYPATRLVYELFMGAYALVFPAYVWIVMVERGGTMSRRVLVWAVAVALAAPFLWMGYIEQRYPWLIGAVGIPLLAGLVARVRSVRPAV